LEKMSGMRFPVRLVLFLLLATLGGLLAFDIYENDGFGKSRTSRFLDDTGVLVFIDQVSQRVQIYSTKAWEWTRENVPLYYAKTVEKVGPVIEQGWEKTQEGAAWVVNKTEPHREWVKQKVPEAIAWVQEKAPTLYEQAYIYGDQAWHFTKDTSIWAWENAQTHSIWLWEQTKEASASSVVWLKENVFVPLPPEEKCNHL